MQNRTVNVSFESRFLREIDRTARRECRSRSELLREAARAYIERCDRWERLFSMGQAIAKKKGLTTEDISREIDAHRRGKASRG